MKQENKWKVVVVEVIPGLANKLCLTMNTRKIEHYITNTELILDDILCERIHFVLVANDINEKAIQFIGKAKKIADKISSLFLVSDFASKIHIQSILVSGLPIITLPLSTNHHTFCNLLCTKLTSNYETVESVNSLYYFDIGLKQLLYHEFNTPMTALVGFSELLKVDLSANPTDIKPDYIDYINDASHRLIKTVKKFRTWYSLNFSNQENKNAVFKEKIPITSFTEEITNRISINFKRGVRFQVQESLESLRVHSDRFYLGLVLEELIDNAFRHTDASISVSISFNQKDIVIEILDYGTRLCADVLNTHIAFVQYDRNKYEQQGVGVGLSSAIMAAQLLNMSIRFLDNEKLGIKAIVCIPINIEEYGF